MNKANYLKHFRIILILSLVPNQTSQDKHFLSAVNFKPNKKSFIYYESAPFLTYVA